MPNQSTVSVPINVDNKEQLKSFLIRLVERIDVIAGDRGDEGYIPKQESQEELQRLDDLVSARFVLINGTIITIEEDIDNLTLRVVANENDIAAILIDLAAAQMDIDGLILDLDALELTVSLNTADIEALQSLSASNETRLDTVQAGTATTALNKALLLGSAEYQKSEYDALAQQSKDIADKLDAILATLNSAGITS